MPSNPHIGSGLDEFLDREGLLEQVSAVAMKRVIAWQLAEAMKAQKVSKSQMAQLMQTSRSQLDRILGDEGRGMTLETLSRAIGVLGLSVKLEMSGPATSKRARHAGARKLAAKRTPSNSHRIVRVPTNPATKQTRSRARARP